MLVPLAHPGHWLAELLYVLPVVVIVGWIGIQSLRDKRAARRGELPEDQDSRSSSAMS